jgi:NADPH:quinone reductase
MTLNTYKFRNHCYCCLRATSRALPGGSKMRAVQVNTLGGREVLAVSEVPKPSPSSGQVLIRVSFSGVNFIDVYYREGKYKAPLPFILGGEGSGHIEATGEGVEGFSAGDAVAWYGPLGTLPLKRGDTALIHAAAGGVGNLLTQLAAQKYLLQSLRSRRQGLRRQRAQTM